MTGNTSFCETTPKLKKTVFAHRLESGATRVSALQRLGSPRRGNVFISATEPRKARKRDEEYEKHGTKMETIQKAILFVYGLAVGCAYPQSSTTERRV